MTAQKRVAFSFAACSLMPGRLRLTNSDLISRFVFSGISETFVTLLRVFIFRPPD
jgi:hypothetical protein